MTSNVTKLLKHLDKLKGLQEGTVSPIMVHFIPTHRCQLDCVHCCFKNRKDKKADMPFDWFVEALSNFSLLGTQALEFTGGGEPTLWPVINRAMAYAKHLGFHMGIITNGLNGGGITHWEWFDWVRVSLNTLDYRDDIDLSYLNNIPISFCYIWNTYSLRSIGKVVEFSNKHKIVCRVAPDCIVPTWQIKSQINAIRQVLSQFENNEYVFLSDFNIDFDASVAKRCRIHMIKPCLYLDGWVYACPSAELAVENDRQIQPKTRICKYDEIYKWYKSPEALGPKGFDCSYCKYVQQQELLEALLTETQFNEFA